MNIIRSTIDFVKLNHEKGMTIKAYFYSAYYRIIIKFVPMNKIEKIMGVRGEESSVEETDENIRYARLVSFHVNRVTEHTPWESKCFVRALTAQRLLKKKKIQSTLYMGVKIDDGKMVAHAWLRCGLTYVTGGNGVEYSMVAKFRA